VDTSTLKVDSTNDRVGVGTASPATRFHVALAAATYGEVARFYDASGNGISLTANGSSGFNQITSTAAQPLIFNVNSGERYRLGSDGTATWSVAGTTAMTLNSTGLGIGATPVERLTIGSTTAANYIKLTNSGATTGFLIGSFNTSVDIKNREAGAMNFFTSDTQRMVIAATGDVTVSTGNVVMATSGKGIDFSATASGSGTMTSELLNDYEEGTWTGTIGGATTNPTTPVTSTGRYTKIGRQVSVEIGFYGDTTGASGRITVSGLPFTSNASLSRPGVIAMDTMGTFTGSPVAYLAAGVTLVELFASNSNGSLSNVTHNAGAGRALYMELTYTV